MSWFKSVFRGPADSASLRADLATESWPDVPLRPVLVTQARPPAPPAADDQDEDWDAVIARARVQTVTPNAQRLRPPDALRPAPKLLATARALYEWDDAPDTPPPVAIRASAAWAGDPDQLRVRLDALLAKGRALGPRVR